MRSTAHALDVTASTHRLCGLARENLLKPGLLVSRYISLCVVTVVNTVQDVRGVVPIESYPSQSTPMRNAPGHALRFHQLLFGRNVPEVIGEKQVADGTQCTARSNHDANLQTRRRVAKTHVEHRVRALLANAACVLTPLPIAYTERSTTVNVN